MNALYEKNLKVYRSQQLVRSRSYMSEVLKDCREWLQGHPEVDSATKALLLKYPHAIQNWLRLQYDLSWWSSRVKVQPEDLWQDVPDYAKWTDLVNSIEQRSL